jgi:dienelactone hydrolase
MLDREIGGFAPPEKIAHAGIDLPVYASLNGSLPLIVMHELPGMSPSFIAYCRRMADAGYKVYMPLMFGEPTMQLGPVGAVRLYISAEFRRLFSASREKPAGRPFTSWLLHLVDDVRERHPGSPIGVVGMCLTGGFALAALAKPNVDAAIACQPSWPLLFNVKSLGLSDAERDGAVARAKTLPRLCAKGYRYAHDIICRPTHMCAAKAMFDDAFQRQPDLPGRSHSTLTGSSASEAVFRDVLEFLDHRLRR